MKGVLPVGLHSCGSMVGGTWNQRGLLETGLAKYLQMLICHTRLLATKL